LLKGIIVRNPKDRLNITDALQNFWFTNSFKSCEVAEEADNAYHKSFVRNIKNYLERQTEQLFNVGRIKPKDFHKQDNIRPLKSMSMFKTLNSTMNSQTNMTMVSNFNIAPNLYQSGYSIYEMNNQPLLQVTPLMNNLNNTFNSALSRGGSKGGKGSSTRVSYVFMNSKNFEESIEIDEESNLSLEKDLDKYSKNDTGSKILDKLLNPKVLDASHDSRQEEYIPSKYRSSSAKKNPEKEAKPAKKVLWLRKKKRK
jgi:hypothetical protein